MTIRQDSHVRMSWSVWHNGTTSVAKWAVPEEYDSRMLQLTRVMTTVPLVYASLE